MSAEQAERRFDPFRVPAPDERARHLAGYLEFLRGLDGDFDVAQRRLERRERYFDELARKPVESEREIDHASFHANFASAGSADLDRRTAWLVVAAKANSGESYGVDRELHWIAKAGGIPTADELYLRMLLQESYHTRILREACRTVGIEVATPLPHWNQRVLIHVIMRLPDSVRWTLVICAEIVGSAIFEILLANCDLFSDEPEVEARLRSLLGEILRDELLHVAYLRARIGPRALRAARKLAPLVARAALVDLPQLAALGATRRALLERVFAGLAIPEQAHWMEADPAPLDA